MTRAGVWIFTTLCASAIAVVLLARLCIGPADLYEKDQPKTLAYTADILLNGRWALPRDVIFQPATKPPLYNWIAACVMKTTGSWSEFAMKSPSVLGAIGVGALLVFADRKRWWIGLLAAAIWFAYGVEPRHGATIRLLFLARPDMLQAFFLTGAWLAATRAFIITSPTADQPSLSSRRWGKGPEVFLFWACITGAILTKGPMALLAILFAVLAAVWIGGSRHALRRLNPLAGIAMTTLFVGAWFLSAYGTDASHVRSVMLGAEIVGRVKDETPEGIANPFYFSAMWFITKGGPFSLVAIAVAALALTKRRSVDPLTCSAALWMATLLVGLSIPAGKRIDYLLPAFVPAAWLAARGLIVICERMHLPIALVALLPLAASLMLARAHLSRFHESQLPLSDRAIAFTDRVRQQVPDHDRLLVLVRGKHPLTTLLHRHPGSYLVPQDLRDTRWIILPLTDTFAEPILRSELLPLGFETIDTRPLAVLGLFDMQSSDRPTEAELIAAAQRMGEWSVAENPYRSAGTVWRE